MLAGIVLVIAGAPVDCSGGASVTPELCAARGCESRSQGCFYKGEGVRIEKVHVIHSNHFDAGYADLTAEVVNRYFDDYFPLAAKTGAALQNATGQPLRWMTFAYLVSLFLDCPPGMGLHCPDAAAVAGLRAAVAAEHIVFPAFPTNAELAAADAASLTFGVAMSNATADAAGGRRSRVVSTRDVPGMPRSAIPILRRAGVRALSEGMNSRMVPVNVPPFFMWRDEASGEQLPVLWHWHGYGQIGEPGWTMTVVGSADALAYNWRGDNAGPPQSVEEVLKDMAKVQEAFPGAEVFPSTLDAFVDAAPLEGLPVVTRDLADTWVWGMASDPVKLAQMRGIHRARAACEAAGHPECSVGDARYYNLSRLAQKNLEHTWGVSVRSYGRDADVGWGNEAFHRRLAEQSGGFVQMVASWKEQRDWGVRFAVDALRQPGPPHPLLEAVEAELAAQAPRPLPDPTAAGFAPGHTVVAGTGGVKSYSIDPRTGALSSLVAARTDAELAGGMGLGLLRYQSLVLADFEAWQKEYLIPGSGGLNEFGKPASFMRAAPTPARHLEPATVVGSWVRQRTGEAIVQLRFASELHADYGAPAEAWLAYTPAAAGLRVDLFLVNKTATRLPEALYFGMHPAGAGNGTWAMDKLGGWVSPLDEADGASKSLHCISSGVRFNDVTFVSKDAALLRWNDPMPFPTPIHTQPDLGKGASFLLYNNVWNTNYPDWFPFDGHADLRFRFEIVV